MRRVIEQRLSPQYVSVHATDLDVRAYLLGIDRQRADISEKMQRMIDAGIEIHAQVVLCPKINDGEVLRQTIYDLAQLHPHVRSVAIVPLGLTRYLNDARLTPVTPEFCAQTIKQVSAIQRDLKKKLGTRFAYLGDEIYLKAGQGVPSRQHYGDCPQIEDGVGMVRTFTNQINSLIRSLGKNRLPETSARGTIMTGTLFAPVLKEMIAQLNERCATRLKVVGVPNEYFGGDVSVAGLLTGGDQVAARDQVVGDFVIIPQVTLKSDEPVMLDGMRLEQLQAQFDVPVIPCDFSAFSSLLRNGFQNN
jgi:putative radical SAM enzyme (TIGR03279 family)